MKILDSDCFSLTERRVRLYSRGVTVTRWGLCGVCNKEPFVNDVTFKLGSNIKLGSTIKLKTICHLLTAPQSLLWCDEDEDDESDGGGDEDTDNIIIFNCRCRADYY